MSNHQDNYEAALEVALAALDALVDERSRECLAFDPDAEDYSHAKHCVAAGERIGVTDALALVTGMLSDYRATRAGVA